MKSTTTFTAVASSVLLGLSLFVSGCQSDAMPDKMAAPDAKMSGDKMGMDKMEADKMGMEKMATDKMDDGKMKDDKMEADKMEKK